MCFRIKSTKKLNSFLRSRKVIADRYKKELKYTDNIFTPDYSSKYKSSYHLYIINLKIKNLSIKEN